MHQRLLIVQNGQRRSWPASQSLRHGALGNEQTLRYAAAMVREDAVQDDRLRALAESLIQSCAPHDSQCEVQKLFEFVRDQIRYVEDAPDTERIADAWRTYEHRAGDCGDKSILLASLLACIGYRSQFVVQSWDGDLSDGYDHVHIAAFMPDGSVVELDPTNENAGVNWEAPDKARARFPIWSDDVNRGLDQSTGVGGFWDDLAPQLINQGVAAGSQYAAGAAQQSRVTKAQETQINSQWNGIVQQVLALLQNISARLPNITADDLAQATQAYQAVEQFVAQYGTEYIRSQWNSPSYKAAFQHDLSLYQQALAAPSTAAAGSQVVTLADGSQVVVSTGTTPGFAAGGSGLLNSPWTIAGIAVIVLLLLKGR